MPRGPKRLRTAEGKLNGIYERLRLARQEAKMTQGQLAARVGVSSEWNPSREDINRIERGERIVSDLECAVLAAVLEKEPAWLAFGTSAEATEPAGANG